MSAQPDPLVPVASEANGSASDGARGQVSDAASDPFTTADVVALLAIDTSSPGGDGVLLREDTEYEGYVALALDAATLAALDNTIELLTKAADLFDVPAMEFSDVPADVPVG